MTEELFTVYDTAAHRFLSPFAAPTLEVAIRQFRSVVNQPGHQFNTFPEDYTLFHVGSFDPENGLLDPLDTPHSLGIAVTFLDPSVELDIPLGPNGLANVPTIADLRAAEAIQNNG